MELQNTKGSADHTHTEHSKQVNKFLLDFVNNFEKAKRGGIHDFLETAIFNMLKLALENIDTYLDTGHKEVIANEILAIVTDSFQKALDDIKKNLENLKRINFQ